MPFMYHTNTESELNVNPIVTNQTRTEAQTVCGRLDTHFSCFNFILKDFVEDGNDATLEEHALDTLTFRSVVAVTMAVLFHCTDVNG